MASFIHPLALLLTVVAVSNGQFTSGLTRPTSTRDFSCPQENGNFENRDDCGTYWVCVNNVATLVDCPAQRIYNPTNGYCDWPWRVANPRCPRQRRYQQSICQENPSGNSEEAFQRPHPLFCNVFYTCSPFYVHTPCTVCAAGTYFPEGESRCIAYGEQDVRRLCTDANKRFLEPADNALTQLECWPFDSEYPNPYQPIIDLIRSGTGGPRNTVRPFQPTLPNRGG